MKTSRSDMQEPLALLTAREHAAGAIAAAAQDFPDILSNPIDTRTLNDKDARLAVAIHRTVLQRWLTLEAILNLFLRKPLSDLEPLLQGVLLTGGAQIVFMNKIPDYAAIDQSVNLAKKMIRPGAGGITNAVLRKVAQLPGPTIDKPWTPDRSSLPIIEPSGASHNGNNNVCASTFTLNKPVLPDTKDKAKYLSAATSHGWDLTEKWINNFGYEKTKNLCIHSLINPPTIVAVESSFQADSASALYTAHLQKGFIVWQGKYSNLQQFLAGHLNRRVQDPASALAVTTAAEKLTTAPKRILDLCAGKGTKTRQLAKTFPESTIVATDTNPARLNDLQKISDQYSNIQVVDYTSLDELKNQPFDLILLDVPCSNTAVLSRRPQAKYRFNHSTLNSLINLQRDIAKNALTLLAENGFILYSTCSLEKEENDQQAQWIANACGGKIVQRRQELPSGANECFHNGSFHALIGPH